MMAGFCMLLVPSFGVAESNVWSVVWVFGLVSPCSIGISEVQVSHPIMAAKSAALELVDLSVVVSNVTVCAAMIALGVNHFSKVVGCR